MKIAIASSTISHPHIDPLAVRVIFAIWAFQRSPRFVFLEQLGTMSQGDGSESTEPTSMKRAGPIKVAIPNDEGGGVTSHPQQCRIGPLEIGPIGPPCHHTRSENLFFAVEFGERGLR